jgi:hypothetical protein
MHVKYSPLRKNFIMPNRAPQGAATASGFGKLLSYWLYAESIEQEETHGC